MPLLKPTSLNHLAKANSSLELYRKLKAEGDFLDWAVTALFYAAMHLVQAYLVETAKTGFDIPRSHPDRDSAVLRQLPDISISYSELSKHSQWARYNADRPNPTPSELQMLENDHFKPIEESLKALGIGLDES